ncbi:hypothetical protein GGP91_001968 [Salinibacter ruber]|nr:hypothetical protein [Salinibacter ruber]
MGLTNRSDVLRREEKNRSDWQQAAVEDVPARKMSCSDEWGLAGSGNGCSRIRKSRCARQIQKQFGCACLTRNIYRLQGNAL